VVDDLQRRLVDLRFVEGIEKVEHVPYPTGDQFWVRFNRQLDLEKFDEIAKKHGCVMLRFASLPSKLPRPIAEILWDGISHVITKRISGWAKFTASLGFEPDGIAKIATDLHGPYQIYISMREEGVQILYEYLGLKYVPPAPPAVPVAPAKSPVPAAVKPATPLQRPTSPPTPVVAKQTPTAQPSPAKPAQEAPTQEPEPPKPTAQVVGPAKKEGDPQTAG
jgi:hypothetical protein